VPGVGAGGAGGGGAPPLIAENDCTVIVPMSDDTPYRLVDCSSRLLVVPALPVQTPAAAGAWCSAAQ
jgi:hypothetical protein